MLDTLTAINIADFKARYANTFGYLVNPGSDKLLVQITGVNDKQVYFQDYFERDLYAYRDSNVMFEFIPVNRGWLVSDGTPYFLTRVPHRQWRRGIHPDNTGALTFSDRFPIDMHNASNKLFHILHCQETETLRIAVANYLSKERDFCVLSKHFAISPGKQVYLFNQKIGKIVSGTIVLDSSLVHQELFDLITRNDLPFNLKVTE